MHKILIVGPSWLGDMIMAQALFKTLKEQQPCLIDVVAPAWSSPILARMAEVNTSIELPVAHGEIAIKKRYALAKQLRANQYDQAIVLPNSWKSALLPFWAKIARRTGWLGELRWGLLNDVRYLDRHKLPTMMQRYVALAASKTAALPTQLLYPSLMVDQNAVQDTLDKFKLPRSNNKVMALCPGAAFGSAKRWPEQYFATLAQTKITAGWDVWFFGSQQDEPSIMKICQQLAGNYYNLAGKLQLTETVDLLSVADVVISNDSGLLHMASSLNKYVIGIYGSTSPAFAPPFGQHARVVTASVDCSPCCKKICPLQHHRCMREITPEQILALLGKDGW